MTEAQISEIIELAWADDVSFDAIRETHGLDEQAVIALMRRTLKPSSFRLWRKRVTGRTAKHRARALSAPGAATRHQAQLRTPHSQHADQS